MRTYQVWFEGNRATSRIVETPSTVQYVAEKFFTDTRGYDSAVVVVEDLRSGVVWRFNLRTQPPIVCEELQ